MNESKVLGKFARLYVSKITKFGVMLRSIDEINSSVQRYTEQTGYGTVTEILKKKIWKYCSRITR